MWRSCRCCSFNDLKSTAALVRCAGYHCVTTRVYCAVIVQTPLARYTGHSFCCCCQSNVVLSVFRAHVFPLDAPHWSLDIFHSTLARPAISLWLSFVPSSRRAAHDMETTYHLVLLLVSVIEDTGNKCTIDPPQRQSLHQLHLQLSKTQKSLCIPSHCSCSLVPEPEPAP